MQMELELSLFEHHVWKQNLDEFCLQETKKNYKNFDTFLEKFTLKEDNSG